MTPVSTKKRGAGRPGRGQNRPEMGAPGAGACGRAGGRTEAQREEPTNGTNSPNWFRTSPPLGRQASQELKSRRKFCSRPRCALLTIESLARRSRNRGHREVRQARYLRPTTFAFPSRQPTMTRVWVPFWPSTYSRTVKTRSVFLSTSSSIFLSSRERKSALMTHWS